MASCATPPPQKPVSTWLGMLPAESSLLISIKNVKGTRPLLNGLLGRMKLDVPDVRTLLDKTEKIFAAVTFSEKGPLLFSILLIGRYPRAWISFGMGFNKNWRRAASSAGYWEHKKTKLKLAHHAGYMIILSNGNMEKLLSLSRQPEPGTYMQEIALALDTADGFFLFPRFCDNAIPRDIPINTKKLPIREVWFGIETEKHKFSVRGAFNLGEKKNAELFLTTFKTFIIWLMRNAHVAKFVPRVEVAVDSHLVRVVGSLFTKEEVLKMIDVLAGKDRRSM
jgi:hypothetical protein